MLFVGERIFWIVNLDTVVSAVFLHLEMPNSIKGRLSGTLQVSRAVTRNNLCSIWGENIVLGKQVILVVAGMQRGQAEILSFANDTTLVIVHETKNDGRENVCPKVRGPILAFASVDNLVEKPQRQLITRV